MLQWPALSVPNGYLGEGLPVGLQILGRAWDEAKIVGYAYAYEQATHYRSRPRAYRRSRESAVSTSYSMTRARAANAGFALCLLFAAACTPSDATAPPVPSAAAPFELVEATIADIQAAMLARELTTVELVQLTSRASRPTTARASTSPRASSGPITTIPNAGPDQRAHRR